MATKIAPSSWLASVFMHAGAFTWLVVGASSVPVISPPQTMEMTIAPSEPAPAAAAAPAPAPEAPPKPVAERPLGPAPPRRDTPREVTPASPTAPDEPALDLTGTTLTSERGSFVSRVGDGAPMDGPIGAGGGGRAPAHGAAVPTIGVALTPKEDLSRLPAPPDLADRLLAMYPPRAKALGDAGRASLSLVVLADGGVASIDVRSASSPDFAQACKDTVTGSRWAPPLDRNGRAVATRVGYTCRFDVR
jgi:outer membrane biosynthesis protein TonB